MTSGSVIRALSDRACASITIFSSVPSPSGATMKTMSPSAPPALVDAVLLQPLPFADQDELVVLWEKDDPRDNPHIEVSLPNFEDWRAEAGSFADMAAMGSTTWGAVEVQRDPPVRLTISAVSASFFDTLGARALVGRTLLLEEDGAEAERVLVLSHAAWRQYFDGDPAWSARRRPTSAAAPPRCSPSRSLPETACTRQRP